jgi:hypothetical protein
MAKVDVVSAQLTAIQTGETQVLTAALGACYDAGEAAGTGPGFTQADIDAAVKAATDPLNAAVASAQSALTDMTTKEQLEETAVAALQKTIDAIKALLT